MSWSSSSVEQQVFIAGNRLAVEAPPSDDKVLLLLLHRLYYSLLRVDQSPSKSMEQALSPSLMALVTHKLLHHPNSDVKVAVASCITQITRITAPDAPYDDHHMMQVFRLIVSSFANLSDVSSRLYEKRKSILDTLAEVRLCVLMLDLECDTLIVDMFRHFFKEIRDYHPDSVFLSMETIMILVLEESEHISNELLSPILASVKNDNKEVLPIVRKLGENVLASCAAKVKPYLIEAVNSLKISVHDYSPVVASICEQEIPSAVLQSDGRPATPYQMDEENRWEMTFSDDYSQVDEEIDAGETSTKHAVPAIEKSPKSVLSNNKALKSESGTVASPSPRESLWSSDWQDHTLYSPMTHSSSDRGLEEQLFDVGNWLVHNPPVSDDQLLLLLDQVNHCLLRVNQSPKTTMQQALSPTLTALVADNLVHHPNSDVKVAVASCISEITRITAPDAPYDDDQMKEVFQLIVSSFANLSDVSSRWYAKRKSILETASTVKSYAVMLDLECDTLIVEMFKHFLEEIRDHHPESVFSSMETIMRRVLEESEDISKELLSPILASVKMDNEPIARKLGERVLKSCAQKVKPYLMQALLDGYSPVVASICQ